MNSSPQYSACKDRLSVPKETWSFVIVLGKLRQQKIKEMW